MGPRLKFEYPDSQSLPLGVVVKRSIGVTRWAKYAWKASAVLPGAGPADWKVLRSDGDVTEFHAATLPLTLYVSDAEAYAHELQARTPSVYAVLRPRDVNAEVPWTVALVTASPYEAQDYCDSAEELVEKIINQLLIILCQMKYYLILFLSFSLVPFLNLEPLYQIGYELCTGCATSCTWTPRFDK